jgi:hypothetical protein
LLPLTETARFKIQLQKGNRFQVPTIVRWQYKLEISQTLNVEIELVNMIGVRESFLAKMRKDGRITVPALIVASLKQFVPDIKGYMMEITLQPG